jgi:anti-sigma regulatory factor (Ser/Thr protein kinase)
VTLPFDLTAPSAARRFLRRHDLGTVDSVELLVSEVVTNAVRHGAPQVTLVLLPTGDDLEVRVSDGSHDVPVDLEPDTLEEGGRGLGILKALSQSWGIEQHMRGKTIWFRVQPD